MHPHIFAHAHAAERVRAARRRTPEGTVARREREVHVRGGRGVPLAPAEDADAWKRVIVLVAELTPKTSKISSSY